ncbi:MAG: hypothetical protein IKZ58_02980 [Selenomonadaceae bacterium]|nr:hypothetical protein [Selenomonadaceae bacterium]
MDYHEPAKRINERLRISHTLSISDATTEDKERDDKEFLLLWNELNGMEERMTNEQYKEFKNLCPFFESFCMIAAGIEWDKKHDIKRW